VPSDNTTGCLTSFYLVLASFVVKGSGYIELNVAMIR